VALSKKEQIVGAGGGKEGLNPSSRSGSKLTTKAPAKKSK
jgi:hypothetical protein